MICRLTVDSFGKIVIGDNTPIPTDLQALIDTDKQYGLLDADPDGWITWKVYDYDTEVNLEQVNYLVRVALMGWGFKVNAKFRPANRYPPCLKIYFSDPEHDPNMTPATLAYHYYPMGKSNSMRGVCYINRSYYYTIDGKPLDLSIIDPKNYPKPAGLDGKTYDLDRILRHEFGHGVFGLQHDGSIGNCMSAYYDKGSEFLTDRDIFRAAAKVGKKTLKAKMLDSWYKIKSNVYS